ncbi:YceI family protein [Paraglaciecola aquimarina]|uniref:YceI family protein n=1 Tax=Paraglaciecola algarum TaxID=3050085 RepID=A0ABS9D5N6_9ALTE|nr:YceI family protein [Paraglaciecola sp. G1-23]MCF2948186.1 YceI family protein [Paraglaciecola sp. G1-23]
MRKLTITLLATFAIAASTLSNAAEYVVDVKGAHAFINFKASHLGYSWLTGRFNKFDGSFTYDDKNPSASKITVNIDPASIDSNHAERDKHLRSDDFLSVDKFPESKFVSTKIVDKGDKKLEVVGNFTLHGVTRSIVIDAVKVGEGKDPWNGYRAGFTGTTTINVADYDFKNAWVGNIELELHIEGIRQ